MTSFHGRNGKNGMTRVFSGHESNIERLGQSREITCWPPTTPIHSHRNSSFGEVWRNAPTPCLKRVQRYWQSGESIHPLKNLFFQGNTFFYSFFLKCTKFVSFLLYPIFSAKHVYIFLHRRSRLLIICHLYKQLPSREVTLTSIFYN